MKNFADGHVYNILPNDIAKEVDRNSKAPFIKNFKENYVDGEVPIYALVEVMSFGTLSKFYNNMLNSDKKDVAATFGVGYTYLQSWLESIAYVRNICAHYGRLYNAKLTKKQDYIRNIVLQRLRTIISSIFEMPQKAPKKHNVI